VTIAISAHAKINPYLWVGGKRGDGYHEIDTVLQATSLCDTLIISPSSTFSVRCSDASLDGDSNLVSKAYRLACEIVDLPQLDVFIEKRIPTQAGLGGGSSDAAAALRVFNEFAHGALSGHLSDIGLACGSDVPFFLGSSTRARATSRGELLEPMATEMRSLVIAKPLGVSCETRSAYAQLDALPNRPLNRPDIMPYNDFERVAPCESLVLLNRFKSIGVTECGLCGSGSAVYGFSERAGEVAASFSCESVWAVESATITTFGEMWTP
jgi:4-diphosphocytidyl-2-C-methyl-D-erythritol kinase